MWHSQRGMQDSGCNCLLPAHSWCAHTHTHTYLLKCASAAWIRSSQVREAISLSALAADARGNCERLEVCVCMSASNESDIKRWMIWEITNVSDRVRGINAGLKVALKTAHLKKAEYKQSTQLFWVSIRRIWVLYWAERMHGYIVQLRIRNCQ